MRKECVAMLLAGGEGSRLGALTKHRAKPSVPFGGKYRIIDFTLSNCVNSAIDTVGVLTQYEPLELNDYIGNGGPWDLNRLEGGVHILPPYKRRIYSDWYKGTANAVSQNISFIDRYRPEYVVILSGDHIYKMDYMKMLRFHKENNADCTIAVIEVDIEDASRFGIMNAGENGAIYEFEEKPLFPKSNKASMGVYIFNWNKLKAYLKEDEYNPASCHDFGKDIIPTMLAAKERMYAYPFKGYWKDVGTIESLWEANMDLLGNKHSILSSNRDWPVYTRSNLNTPLYIGCNAKLTNCIVAEGCNIEGNITASVIFYGVTIEEDTYIRNSIILPGAYIKKGSVITNTIITENVIIDENYTAGNALEITIVDEDNPVSKRMVMLEGRIDMNMGVK